MPLATMENLYTPQVLVMTSSHCSECPAGLRKVTLI